MNHVGIPALICWFYLGGVYPSEAVGPSVCLSQFAPSLVIESDTKAMRCFMTQSNPHILVLGAGYAGLMSTMRLAKKTRADCLVSAPVGQRRGLGGLPHISCSEQQDLLERRASYHR
jgi:hypothetical protein